MSMKKAITTGILTLAAAIFAFLLIPSDVAHQQDYQVRSKLVNPALQSSEREAFYKRLLSNSATGEIEIQDRLDSWNSLQSMSFPKSLALTFGELGPDNVGGRTRAIGIDRNNDNIMYAGSVGGGLFKSTDAGNNWNRVDGWDVVVGLSGSISVSSIETTDNGTLYVAMGGNRFEVGDLGSGESGEQSGSRGVWYSTNNGDSFTQLGGTSGDIMQLWRDPSQVNKIYIGGPTCQVSENLGAATVIADVPGNGYDVKVSGDGSVVFFAARDGSPFRYYVSTDFGANFNEIPPAMIASTAGRAESTVSDVKNASGFFNIYVSTSTLGGSLLNIHLSEDHGLTWDNIGPGGAALFTPFSNGVTNQGNYDQIISYIPGKPEECLLGGINQYHWEKTPGSSPAWGGWMQISTGGQTQTSPTYIHSDQHEMKWNSAGTYFYGNDGGIGSSFGTPPAGILYPMNKGYNVTQFYSVAFNKNGAVMGGTQDNGTLYNDYSFSSAQQFKTVVGGDGFDCDMSHYNPEAMFGTIYNSLISRSEDNGNVWQDISPNCSAPTGLGCGVFHTPLRLFEDPNDTDSKDFVQIIPDSTILSGTVINYNSATYDPSIPENLLTTTTTTSAYFSDTLTAIDTASNGDYFAFHPGTGDTVWMGNSIILLNYAFDTLYLQDPVQSIMASLADGIVITRDALRFGMSPEWWDISSSTIYSGIPLCFEFSWNGNILYVGSTDGVYRFKGLDSVYDAADVSSIQVTKIYNSGRPINGIGIDKNDSDRLVIAAAQTGGNGVIELTGVESGGTLSGNNIQGNIPTTMAVLDVIVDYRDPSKLIAATDFGVWATSDNGTSWIWCGNETGPVPVFAIRQQQREWNEATNAGEIYLGTHGRGIWSSQSVLSTPESIVIEPNPASDLSIYPNPVREYANISFLLNSSSDVELNIHGLNGQLISTVNRKSLPEGNNQMVISTSELSSGTYVVSVLVDGNKINAKMMKH
jgi:hypothetical protein